MVLDLEIATTPSGRTSAGPRQDPAYYVRPGEPQPLPVLGAANTG